MKNLSIMLRDSLRLIMVLSVSLIYTEAVADKINSVTVTLPGNACKAVTYNNGQDTVPKDANGNYSLTSYNNYTTGASKNYKYTCWNSKGDTPSSVAVLSLSGSFAYIDPSAYSNPVWGGIRFQVDNDQVPCDHLLSVAYATSPGYRWCENIADFGTSGGKDGLNNWWVNAPGITLNESWQSLSLELNEWGKNGDWYKTSDGVSLSVIQAYSPF